MEMPGMSHLKTECGQSHSGPMADVEFNDNSEKVDSLEEDVKAGVVDLVPSPAAEVLHRNDSCITNPNIGTSTSTLEAVQNGLVGTLSVKKEPNSSCFEYNSTMRSDLQKDKSNEDDLYDVKPRLSNVPSMAESSQTQEQVSIFRGKRPASGGEVCFPQNAFSLVRPPVPVYCVKNEFFRRRHFLKGRTNNSNMNSHEVDPMNDTTTTIDKDWIKKEPDDDIEMPLGGDCGSSLLIDGRSVVEGHAVSKKPLLEIDYADNDIHQTLLSSAKDTDLKSDVKESYTENLQEAVQLDDHFNFHHPIYTKELTETDGTSFESSVGSEEVNFEDGPMNHGELKNTDCKNKRTACGKFIPHESGEGFSIVTDLNPDRRKQKEDKRFPPDRCVKHFLHNNDPQSNFRLMRALICQERIRTRDKPFICSVCDKGFCQMSNLVRHEKNHTRGKPFKCALCDKGFSRMTHLDCHGRIHTGEKPFKCSVCDKDFSQKSTLVLHERIHTNHTREKPFKCGMCDKGFSRMTHLDRHERIHTGEKPFKCSVCDKDFNQKSTLVSHERIHTNHTGEKPFKCGMCDKGFRLRSNLVRHERVHTGEKSFRCSVCDKDFWHKFHLDRHKRIHTGEKSFKCSVCDEDFRLRSNLVRHESIHTGGKPFRCNVCDKDFWHRSNLDRHERIHTGEKPFKCSVCDRDFSQKSSLVLHERIHTGEKPFKCSVCDLDFRKRSALLLHEKIHL